MPPVGSSIGGAGFNETYPGILDAEMGSEDVAGPSYPMQLLEGMPTLAQTVGATGFRGSNTILRGGWADTPGPVTRARRSIFARGKDIQSQGALRNNNLFNPRTWTRYGSQDMFFPGQGGAKQYRPFNIVPNVINWAAKNQYLGKGLQEAALANKGEAIGGGVFSQLSAAERMRKVGAIDPGSRRGQSLESYFQRAKMFGGATTGMEARTALHQSMRGPLGQMIGGYAEALRNPMVGNVFGPGPYKGPANISPGFARGAAGARGALMGLGGLTEAQVAGRIGMKAGYGAIKGAVGGAATNKLKVAAGAKVAGALGARMALSAVPFVNVAMWAWMAYDITKALIPASGKFIADAYKSYTGWGSNRMLGGNFKMNEAGMTSRSRGVAAIQNSRMNARSVLGAEAGGLAAYYG